MRIWIFSLLVLVACEPAAVPLPPPPREAPMDWVDCIDPGPDGCRMAEAHPSGCTVDLTQERPFWECPVLDPKDLIQLVPAEPDTGHFSGRRLVR